MTSLMEFNYLSLPRGALARKRPSAGAQGRTVQEERAEGRGRERRSFPPVERKWITFFFLTGDVSFRRRRTWRRSLERRFTERKTDGAAEGKHE